MNRSSTCPGATAPTTDARRRAARGFTLIELMVTVAIIGVLAAIAYPSYRDSIRKSDRAQARAAVMEMLAQQERQMTQTGSYLAVAGSAASTQMKNWVGDAYASSKYTLSAAACANSTIDQCVQVTATRKTAADDPAVTSLGQTSNGAKFCTPNTTPVSTCW